MKMPLSKFKGRGVLSGRAPALSVYLRPGAGPYDTLRLRLEGVHAVDSRLPLWRLEKEGEAE